MKRIDCALPISLLAILLFYTYYIITEVDNINYILRVGLNDKVTNANIVNKKSYIQRVMTRYAIIYDYDIEFTKGIKKFKGSSVIKKKTYNSLRKGDEVQITYNQLKPEESYYGDIKSIQLVDILKTNIWYFSLLLSFYILLVLLIVFITIDKILSITTGSTRTPQTTRVR